MSFTMKCCQFMVSDSLLYKKELLLLEDQPLAEFDALGIYFYLTKENRIVASGCVVLVVSSKQWFILGLVNLNISRI